MARKPRIEYPGAVYHVMSRGNKREAIFLSDYDREVFISTLGEVCERTGWRIHAYVLMPNHYHLQVETPEANLVSGMKWFQGTYTQRFHIRNNMCGHLFQGRYKALPVSGKPDYFANLSTYIHLNPVRAKLYLPGNNQLLDYPWGSYSLYLRPLQRPAWLDVSRVLHSHQWEDTPVGRNRYKQYIRKKELAILKEGCSADLEHEWQSLEEGWFVGDDEFKLFLRDHLEVLPGRRESYSGEEMHEHDEQEAQRLLDIGLDVLGLTLVEVQQKKFSDTKKCLLAWLLRRKTTVSNGWICEKLAMGRPDCFSRYPRRIEESTDRQILKIKAHIEKCTKIRD